MNTKFYISDRFKIAAGIAVLCIWLIYVLNNAYFNTFNTDEYWAIVIARDLNFFETIKLMHYEGHLSLWYLVLKPFVYIFPNMSPPMFIKFLNLFFLFIAMIIMWFFSPLNIVIKMLITLSSPFLSIYPVLARPYGMSIMLIFLLAAMYKKRLEKPLMYSVLVFLTMNSCFNAFVLAFALGSVFAYDLYKKYKNNKNKKLLIPIIIVLCGILSVAIQWIPFHPCNFVYKSSPLNNLRCFFITCVNINPDLYHFILLVTFGPIFFITLFYNYTYLKNKRILLFIFCTIIVPLIFYSFLPGLNYHLYFFYIYAIVLYWLLKDNVYINSNGNNRKGFISYTIFLILLSIFFYYNFRPKRFWFTAEYSRIAILKGINYIIPKNSRIYLYIARCEDFLYHFADKYEVKNLYGYKIPSYEAYKGIYQDKPLKPDNINYKGDNVYFIGSATYYNIEDFEACEDVKTLVRYYICKLPPKIN